MQDFHHRGSHIFTTTEDKYINLTLSGKKLRNISPQVNSLGTKVSW